MLRIDSHFHIWDLEHRDQDWMTPELAEVIAGPYDIGDWQEEATPGGVTRGIFVQTVAVPDETPEVLQIAAGSAELIGVVGWVDVTSGDPDTIGASLDELLSLSGGECLVGTRVLAEYHPDVDWLDSQQVHAAATALGARDLTLDLLTKWDQLPAAARLVAEHPSTRFVLDHLSKPTMQAGDFDTWASGIAAVASAQNVACKLSGFLTFDGEMTAQRLRPYFDVLASEFGPDRIMFGSDWPVSVLGGGYRRAVDLVTELLAGLDDAALRRVWHGTALQWYPAAARKLARLDPALINSQED